MANKIKSGRTIVGLILLHMIAVVFMFVFVVAGIIFMVEHSVDWANTNCYMNQAKEVICQIKK